MGIYGVIGYPVSHSMSPIMHNQEFQALQMDSLLYSVYYSPESFRKSNRRDSGILHIKGINVTIPHKVEVMDYLDEIDEEARLIGAVNTIKNRKWETHWFEYGW